ncbi:MAG: TlpA family protein disulfide reductase [Mariprofundaceae bacterium]|nr:TlpA family protein disulfide reductase [Mariprofundaceae bacterium]
MLTRWLAVIGIIVVVGAGAWLYLPEAKQSVLEGGVALPFTLPDLKGKTHGLPEGEVVLLNFWATWCPPCRKEMPSMAALHRKYAEKGLKVVAVSVDRDANDLSAFVREYKIPFQVLHDADSSTSHDYGVFRYPETFLIDRQGQVRYHLVGAVEWMSESVTKRIEGLLNESEANKSGAGQKS